MRTSKSALFNRLLQEKSKITQFIAVDFELKTEYFARLHSRLLRRRRLNSYEGGNPYGELQSDRGDEPKGRQGQDHDHRQPRHRTCPAEHVNVNEKVSQALMNI